MSKRMPVAFVGHGSPMNAVEDNVFTRGWNAMAGNIPEPSAILMISAHWVTRGLKVNAAEHPKMTYDMYGFPPELYKIVYSAPGAPELAASVRKLVPGVETDDSWGYDHGNWAVLSRMYPAHDVPLTQLSLDMSCSPEELMKVGGLLKPLRDEGVLLIASGNVVHNLGRVDWNMNGGYPWADSFDKYIRDAVLEKRGGDILHFDRLGEKARLSISTAEHFFPLFCMLGAVDDTDEACVYNDARTLGGLSMTSFLWSSTL